MEFLLLKKHTNPGGVQAIFVHGCWRLEIEDFSCHNCLTMEIVYPVMEKILMLPLFNL